MKKQIMYPVLEIPRLAYPFRDLKNQQAEKIEAESKTWLNNDYTSMPEAFLQKKKHYKYQQTNVGHMGARMYPFATFEKLKPIVRFLLWGLINDDLYEDCPVSELQAVRERTIAVLKGYPVLQHDNSLFDQLKLQREEMLSFMPYYWMNRYIHSIDRGFEGMQLEAYYKSRMIFPTVNDYNTIREKAVLVFPLIDLCELQSGQALPDKVFHHPVIQRASSLVCRIVAYANDYFSVEKERGKDVMNIVLVLEQELGLTTTDAYLKAIELHDNYVDEFCQIAQNLPDFGVYNHHVQRLLDHLGVLISGHKSWYELDTFRYIKTDPAVTA
ncbi:MAG TPA: hypothetical protein VM802_16705 [Chitinophaga sp.]|uniref:terpene synthase family protein n=1 Tax=Chitinophaga sp. TaxID=1869181 RepID=UPI002CA19EE2|nr:hypothetical protein [Chitinophaga sp.]HVI46519.1 hypothetical protein [Chitinophaga sp.]